MLSFFGLLCLALISEAQIHMPFGTIYSVHTSGVPRCPPGYQADSKYIACCSTYDYLTTALAPGSTAVPACCYSDAVSGCTGAAEVMLDWSISTDTILGETTVIPINPASQPTTTAAPKQTQTSAAPVSTTTAGSNSDNNGNTNTNTNEINIHSGSRKRFGIMERLRNAIFLPTILVGLLGI